MLHLLHVSQNTRDAQIQGFRAQWNIKAVQSQETCPSEAYNTSNASIWAEDNVTISSADQSHSDGSAKGKRGKTNTHRWCAESHSTPNEAYPIYFTLKSAHNKHTATCGNSSSSSSSIRRKVNGFWKETHRVVGMIVQVQATVTERWWRATALVAWNTLQGKMIDFF